jgi:hypothetical protein
MKNTSFSLHTFSDLDDPSFNVLNYSALKYGNGRVAMIFGHELADAFFKTHAAVLLATNTIVIPSPYNHVKNAATLLTEHFINRLNHHIVSANGTHVEYSTIHRKVSYINDYGFLSAEDRKGLIDNDKFYFNPEFYAGKNLVFVDDVRITGTHENKLIELLDKAGIKNPRTFVYYANYTGSDPTVESKINLASVSNIRDFISHCFSDHHQMIVRPIKYILGLDAESMEVLIKTLTDEQITNIYWGCIGEGYYKIPSYQHNFNIIKTAVDFM